MVGGTFALNLNQNLQILQIFAVPLVERLQQLQSVTLRVNIHSYVRTVLWWLLVGILTGIKLFD